MRIAFAGTPPFAETALVALCDAGHEIALVLTQPDRPSGRGMKLKRSAVKETALARGLPVISPRTLSVARDPEGAETALRKLEESSAEVLVVAAYGLILPQRALDAASGIGLNGDIRSINIHASLLPRWRGAAPVQRAIEAGDLETGVCLMKMEAGLDTGPIIAESRIPITDASTSGSLTDELAALGARKISSALATPGTLTWRAQSVDGVTYARKVLKSEAPVNWFESATTISRRVRAFNPFPGVTARHGNDVFKILEAHAVEGCAPPGEVTETGKILVVGCSSGLLACTRLQKAGKAASPAASFLQSMPIRKGEILR